MFKYATLKLFFVKLIYSLVENYMIEYCFIPEKIAICYFAAGKPFSLGNVVVFVVSYKILNKNIPCMILILRNTNSELQLQKYLYE